MPRLCVTVFISDASNVFLWPLEQAFRREMRLAINKLFLEPITHDSPAVIKEIGLMLTGRQLSGLDRGDEYTIMGVDHPLRRGQMNFVLCPTDAKTSSEKSSLSALNLPGHKEFSAFLQNLGRVAPVFDEQNRQINQFAQAPFIQLGPSNPVTNIIHGYLIFEVLSAKTPRVEEALLRDIVKGEDGKHDMTKVFERKVLASDQFVVDSGLLALVDYMAAISLWASLTATAVSDMRAFYEIRKRQYEALNGAGGGRNFREELQAELENYLDKFPNTLAKVRKTKRKSAAAPESVVDLTAEELSGWAIGPAGGAKIVVPGPLPVGDNAPAAGAGGTGAGAAGDAGGPH